MPRLREATMSGSEFVTLSDGLIVPIAAVLLALDLEQRGCRMTIEDDALVVGPRVLLNDEDRQQITRWKAALRVIVRAADTVEVIQ
jgi:hypothetical protein